MNRRKVVCMVTSGVAVGLAGCADTSSDGEPTDGSDSSSDERSTDSSGDSSNSESTSNTAPIISGSTNFEETWEVELEESDELELELTLESGIYALANVSRLDNANDVSTLETEQEGTVTDQFTVPESIGYLVVLQVTEGESGGEASIELRPTA